MDTGRSIRAGGVLVVLAGLHGAGVAQEAPQGDRGAASGAAPASTAAQLRAERPDPVQLLLPQVQPAGQGRLRVWGFEVYDARLWVAPGFRHGQFERHGFALELAYLRDFSAGDIAQRSLAEMRRAGDFDAAQAQRWQGALEALLPPVRRGDRLTGVHRPGRGASFLLNDKPVGDIADAEFARLFFAIWLGERSSEPALRRQLIAGTPP